jgi:hypothetical protein
MERKHRSVTPSPKKIKNKIATKYHNADSKRLAAWRKKLPQNARKKKKKQNKTKGHQPPQIKQFVRNKGSQQKASRKQPQNHKPSLRSKNNYYFRQNKNSQKPNKLVPDCYTKMTLKNDSLRICKNLQQSFVVYLEERLLSVRELFEDFGKQNAQTRKCFVF